MKIKLILKKENVDIQTLIIDSFPFMIGRAKENHLVLDEPHISRIHVSIDYQKEKLILNKFTTVGKLKFSGNPLSLPATFAIPPYTFVLELLAEKEFAEEEIQKEVSDAESFRKTEILSEKPQIPPVVEPSGGMPSGNMPEGDMPFALDEETRIGRIR